MKKKIFFGCTITFVILISVSFYSVLGNRQDKFIMNYSPLFTVRINRVTDNKYKNLNCTYVGKENENKIFFPIRNSELSLLYKTIRKINQMDDTSIRDKIQRINDVFDMNELNFENVKETISILFQKVKMHKDFLQDINFEFDTLHIKPFTIYRPLYLLILIIFILTFGLWLPFISLYAGVTCNPCCFFYSPKTLKL